MSVTACFTIRAVESSQMSLVMEVWNGGNASVSHADGDCSFPLDAVNKAVGIANAFNQPLNVLFRGGCHGSMIQRRSLAISLIQSPER